ncbi:GPP34 family phosphoprotein [Kineococcus indalonis]|uniref:GPP34 family phosphoprotein n=1 Tax=Kineococcus indalonis TaxID=2696566 RepID=UPI0014134A5F|nr:GPP34 family phosphoprotein [Kineococcus indalonis]NAZ85411.1 hypothetical protein [Kineococcus indalonis]
MLIADRAALLLLDAQGRRRLPARAAATVLAGALLSELVLLRHLQADPASGALRVRPGPQPAPRLTAALTAVTAGAGDAARTVRALAGERLWEDAASALGEAGALRTERRRRLLVLTRVRWFPREGSVAALQVQLRAALLATRLPHRAGGAPAVDPATVSLLVLLAGAGCLREVVGHLPGAAGLDEAADVLADARALAPQLREALEDLETAVAVRAQALRCTGSSSDTTPGSTGDGDHGGHHGGSDGGPGVGSGGEGGGGDW